MSEPRILGLEPSPGCYVWRAAKGAPRQGVRVILSEGTWHALVSGVAQPGSGAADPFAVPFLLHHWPLHPITEAEYEALLAAHRNAGDAHPLSTPRAPVDLRHTKSLF